MTSRLNSYGIFWILPGCTMPGAFSGHSRFSYGICNENTFCYHFEQVTRLIQAFIPTLVPTACPLMSSSLHRSYRRDMATWMLRKARFLSLSQIPAEMVPSTVERGIKQLQTCLPGIQHVDNGQGQACPMPVCHRAGIWEGTAWSAFLLTGELMPSRLAFTKYLLNEWWSAPLCDST